MSSAALVCECVMLVLIRSACIGLRDGDASE